VRGLERQGSQALCLRTPGPSISASPTENVSMTVASTSVHRTEVVRRYPLPTLDTCERRRELVRVASDVARAMIPATWVPWR
jgi:hypothetical protein